MYKRTKIEAEVHPRFLCLEEFMNYTGLGRGSAMKLGKEIGCVMKVGTEGCGYDKICTFASVPARKTDYQAYLRKALKILNDMLLLKNMPADFPAEKYSETDFQK